MNSPSGFFFAGPSWCPSEKDHPMIVTIMQPAYLPWLGFFDRVAASDLFVVLDHVRMDRSTKTQFANRNKVRTRTGWCWLTVPVPSHGDLLLHRLPISPDSRWQAKHLATLEQCYGKTAHFGAHRDFFRELFATPAGLLAEPVNRSTAYLLDALGIKAPVVFSSSLKERSTKSGLVLNLCREVGASSYISGPFGREYLDRAAFESAGIDLIFHDYAHPEYSQAYPGFEPYMSVVDLLFNHGLESLEILASGRRLNPV